MKNILNKLIYLGFFLIAGSFNIFAQSYNIDYYGIISKELDNNMAKLTSDSYYTKLSEIQNFTIFDKRTTPYITTPLNFEKIITDNLVFYAEIKKDEESENWNVIFSVADTKKNQLYSKSKNYDSFYKILMESKNELQITIKELLNENPELKELDSPSTIKEQEKSVAAMAISSIEALSGTWKGEDTIDKIVISRGGRGFVIFKKGASMNITVTIENNNKGQEIIIKQKGNSNASYYPELPRNMALDAAISAPPIVWTMTLYDNMTMKGTKNTIIQDGDGYKSGSVQVTWKKIS